MNAMTRCFSSADPATWAGRVLGLLLLIAFYGWLFVQLLPMIVGDLVPFAANGGLQ